MFALINFLENNMYKTMKFAIVQAIKKRCFMYNLFTLNEW